MRLRLLILLALLPSLAGAATNYWIGVTNNASASVAANWSLNYIPTNTSDVMAFSGTNGSNTNCRMDLGVKTCSPCFIGESYTGVVLVTATWEGPVRLLQNSGVLTGPGGFRVSFPNGTQTNVWQMTGGLASNITFRINNTSGANDIDVSGYLNNGWLTNAIVWLDGSCSYGFVMTNCAGNAVGLQLRHDSARSVLLSNVTGNLGQIDIGTYRLSNSTNAIFDSSFTCSYFSFSPLGARFPRMLITNSTISCTQAGGAGFAWTVGTNVIIGGVIDSTILLTNSSDSGYSVSSLITGSTNVTLWCNSTRAAGTPINASTTYFTTIRAIGGQTKINASVNCGTLSIEGGSLTAQGYAITANTISQTNGILVASNSTITATTIAQSGGTFSNMTSTVRLSGTSNLTNYYNLAAIGNVTLTNAPITCTGTLYSEAGSYSLNGNGGTLTLTAPSYFNGLVSNATVGAGAPLTAERSQGVGGRFNSIQRMGAE